jgi:hypothetical protein
MDNEVQEEMERLRKRAEEAIKRADEEARRADEEARRADEEARRADEEARRADEEARRADDEARRADMEAKERARTHLVQYLYNVQTVILSALIVEDDRTKSSSGVTSVDNKVYPTALRRWTEFPTLHAGRFDRLLQTLGDSELFPSPDAVRNTMSDLSPASRKNELDIRPFVRAHVESPAGRIVDAYLSSMQPDPRCAAFEFCNSAYSVSLHSTSAEDQPPPAKRRSSGTPSSDKTSSLIPDRWGIRVAQDNARTTVLVGEYKAAHKARARQFCAVLDNDAHPTDSLFADCVDRVKAVRACQPSARRPASSPLARDQLAVAQVLCQAYSYMIAGGLSYGYVASGDCMVLLAIQGPAEVLSFHLVPCSVAMESSQPPTADLTRPTPAAQLATLAVLALEAEVRSPEWIQQAITSLLRWPSAKTTNKSRNPGSLPPPSPRFPRPDEDDEQGSGPRRRKTPQERPLAMLAREEEEEEELSTSSKGSGSQTGDQQQRTPLSVMALPYCTQACLLGLSRGGGALDPNCPNTRLHVRPGTDDALHHHPISKARLCSLIRSQLARNLCCGCERLDKYGMFGRTGALFKITVPEYGYTLVAKGVQAADAGALVNEASIYSHCRHLQGVYIPVHLGNIDLVVPYPLQSLAFVQHMMLMSWAGSTLDAQTPEGVDLEDEIDRTLEELSSAGICHGDERDSNLIWNEEVEGIMAIDFDLACIYARPGKRLFEPTGEEEREGKARKVVTTCT